MKISKITHQEEFKDLFRSFLDSAKEYEISRINGNDGIPFMVLVEKYKESLNKFFNYIDKYMFELENSKKMEAKSVMKLLKKIENNMACCACFTSVKEKN